MKNLLRTTCIVALFAGRVAGSDEKPNSIVPGSPSELSGLLAYWNLDEGKGESVQDASANRLTATVKGARWVAGVKGSALQFEKDGEYLDYGDAPQLNFKAGAPFTFAGWVKTTAPRGAVVSQRSSKDGGANIDVTLDDGKLAGLVRSDGKEFGEPARVMGGAINDGEWHHFALTRDDGRTIELFIDGVSQGTAAGKDAGGSITTDLRALGSERRWVKTGFPNAQFVGAVDEFCVFGRALSGEEIRKLAGPRSAIVKKDSGDGAGKPVKTPGATGKIGKRVQGGGQALTVERVEHKQKIGNATKAEAGKEWLVVHVLIENTGDETEPYNPLYFHIKDEKSVEVGSDSALEDDDLKGGELSKGEKIKGAMAFAVDADSKGLILTYDFGGPKPLKITLDR